jgi:hypothetical protein
MFTSPLGLPTSILAIVNKIYWRINASLENIYTFAFISLKTFEKKLIQSHFLPPLFYPLLEEEVGFPVFSFL